MATISLKVWVTSIVIIRFNVLVYGFALSQRVKNIPINKARNVRDISIGQ